MKSVRELLDAANASVQTVDAAEAMRLLKQDDVAFIDVRDADELERDGKVPGATHVSRGMLEFRIDGGSMHNPVFSSNKRLVFYCAGGGRSALATQTAQNMGLTNVANLRGGFKAWREAGGPVEAVSRGAK